MEAQRRALPAMEFQRSAGGEYTPYITALTRFDLIVTAPHITFSLVPEPSTLDSHCSCWLCGKAVSLEVCKTDEYGKSVHEECYVTRLALEKASAQWVAQNIQQKQDGLEWADEIAEPSREPASCQPFRTFGLRKGK
jgi:hypothetical protein